jgi:hypothetical protein
MERKFRTVLHLKKSVKNRVSCRESSLCAEVCDYTLRNMCHRPFYKFPDCLFGISEYHDTQYPVTLREVQDLTILFHDKTD